ncbi:hypothetical protein [Sporosarcina psychrophila]|uniref:Phage protein n=1 Tax=Sporosarcina psychrophila TaxID=1476 RepID=A0ABV2KBN4_SPOPS
MKTVNVTYFKPSGKYYTSETEEISEELNGYEALFTEIPKRHRIKSMYMHVSDSDDGKEPHIVPHIFHPIGE